MSLLAFVAVGFGGAAGALARGFLGPFIQGRLISAFPWGLLFINILSCCAAGVILRLELGGIMALALTMGFLGGFSTLSAVVFESIEFMFHGHIGKGIANLLGTYACALAAAALGFFAAGVLV